MDQLNIKSTKYTPEILLDADSGVVKVTGKSYPENTFEFYKPMMDWLEVYFEQPKEITTFDMEIIYFNSSSSKFFFDLFDFLEEYNDVSKIVVNWIYDKENESAIEAGEDFIDDFEELTILLVEKK